MARRFEIVTFDCYGTLIDWETGISQAFRRAAARDGVGLARDEVLEAHADIEPIVQAGPYRSYREVLRETARRAARRFDWSLDPADADFLPEILGEWPAFDDTVPALQRLEQAGYRLGILSNIDIDLLAQTLPKLGVEFDLIVTAQDVASYKPANPHFHRARKSIGAARWLHAAQSYFHDVAPASALGIPVAWVNRNDDAPAGEARPDRVVRNLTELADWLTFSNRDGPA